eukprot:TRINITY_DN29777_c0_g1_i1.p1 TRINITY_DN29777_c0_g1~~TRINITY_DN29777_c0_g1_i1.p1  ORF type:complete len:1045 (+),score=184.23 TRINITY_DN29777_c0_g1_i1:87-3137(+)
MANGGGYVATAQAGGVSPKRPPAVVVALVDVHRGLGRALCSAEELCASISDEVCREAAQADARAPWRVLTNVVSSAKRKDELRARIVAVSHAVLSGERPPPGGLPRAIEAVGTELTTAVAACGGRAVCQLFTVADGRSDTKSSSCDSDKAASPGVEADLLVGQDGGAVGRAILPCLFSGMQPDRLPAAWGACAGGNGGDVFSLEDVCGGGFRGATAVVIISSRRPPPPTRPLIEQLHTDDESQASASLSFIHFAVTSEPPPELAEISEVCSSYGGRACIVSDEASLRQALQTIFGGPVDTHEGSVGGLNLQKESTCDEAVGPLQAAEPAFLASTPANGNVEGSFDVSWMTAGPLGLDFQKDNWIVAKSVRPEVIRGDVLMRIGHLVASGPNAANVGSVVAALRSGQRPLVLTFTRPLPTLTDDALEAVREGVEEIQPTKESAATVAASAEAVPASGNTGNVAVGRDVAADVLQKHAKELSRLDPEARRVRIRGLVGQEMSRAGRGPLGRAEASASVAIERVLDADRPVEQRVLLEWFLVLGRVMAYCGDVMTLCRATMVSSIWRSSLRHDGSAIASRLWKWSVRFGDLVPRRCRWPFWRWLLCEGHTLRAKAAKGVCARSGTSFRKRRSEQYFAEKLSLGRSGTNLAEARDVISADLPRTFAAAEAADSADDTSSAISWRRLLPSDEMLNRQSIDFAKRRASLERVLFALAAEFPSVGYCQGMDSIVALAFSVAEESGTDELALEAETFAFVASLLEIETVASWLEPPLDGLRAAGGALASMLQSRCPELAQHLVVEGAGMDLVALPWLQTLLVSFTPLPRVSLCHAWDCLLLDATPKLLFRLALLILETAKSSLVGQPLEQMAQTLRRYPQSLEVVLQPRRLVAEAWDVKVTSTRFRQEFVSAMARLSEQPQQSEQQPVADVAVASRPCEAVASGPTAALHEAIATEVPTRKAEEQQVTNSEQVDAELVEASPTATLVAASAKGIVLDAAEAGEESGTARLGSQTNGTDDVEELQ